MERVKRNVYWDCYNGIRSASVTGKEDEIVDSFEEVGQLFYKIHYQDYVEGQNARNLKNHHPERNRTTDDIRTHKKTCPEETIYQIGTKDDYVDPDVLLIIVTEFITELSDRFGEHFHLLNCSFLIGGIMGLFDEVKENVTVRQAAEFYGFKITKSSEIHKRNAKGN